jgi:hypothetical protein
MLSFFRSFFFFVFFFTHIFSSNVAYSRVSYISVVEAGLHRFMNDFQRMANTITLLTNKHHATIDYEYTQLKNKISRYS